MANPSRIRTRDDWTKALQALFTQAGLSYHALAERCETSASTLHKMVNGQSFPRPSTVRLFVEACGEHDTQSWLDARARVAKADPLLKRHRTPSGRQIRVGTVPLPADCFQDRAVAACLEEAAEAGGTVVLTHVLAGMGGVGKTQLAAAHARRAWDQGVGVLVWVNAATRDGVVSAYTDSALELGLPSADRNDPDRSAQAFLTWTETATDRWWLVVLDDVRSPAVLSGLWPPAAQSATGGQVLVTTRLRAAALDGSDRQVVPIGTFTEPEARAYLAARLGDRVTDPTVADGLAEGLGRLPLALAQAATYIVNEDIDIRDYQALLAGKRLVEVVPEEQDLTDDHQRIVTATWELSIDQADAARPAGLARPVLQLISLLDPAGIPQAVLSSPPALDYLATYLPEAAQHQTLDAETVDAVLRVLHRYSLISHDRTAAYRQVRVHRLVQRATRENLIAQADLGPELFAALADTAADALLAVWPRIERDELGQTLRTNADALRAHAGEALWTAEGYHGLLAVTGQSLGQAGQVAAAATYFEWLHEQAVRRLGPDHRYTLAALGNQAVWLAEAGDRASVPTARRLAGTREGVLGPRHPDTLTARHTLARAHGQTGDLEGAVADLESLLADRTAILGADHPDTLTTRHNLAQSKGDLALRRGADVAGVVTEFTKILDDTRRGLGADHPDTLSARHELARWRSLAGDPEGAAAEFAQLRDDRARVLGADHPHTLKARNELAAAIGRSGDPVAARAAFERVLADRKRVLGPDHPDTLNTRLHLIDVSADVGAGAPAAIAELEALLDDILRVLTPFHDDAWNACLLIALLRDKDADPRVRVPEELLAASLRALGPDHPEIWRIRGNVAIARAETGDVAGTVASLQELVDDFTRLHGPRHEETLVTRAHLARWRANAGDHASAIADYEELLADRLHLHGPDHPAVLFVRAEIAEIHGSAGDPVSAAAAHEELLAGCLRVLGPDDPDTLAARNNHARALGDAGDPAGAATAFEELFADCVRILGPDHPRAILVRQNLAHFRDLVGDLAAGPVAEPGSPAPSDEASGRQPDR
ncbi:tetratricopeptide repeat protein [Streptomyces sp. LUP30]|uniref:tetratricopeptide repeat protein n=1 Tax=Streptomyces sp. LUP30 TaxID=1890285 RepID=UPI000851579F|nr:tetratricopeptide repeat protein [Streptomyces sp. LUP30]